ncbi:MAG TPA: hypothetical protein PK360_21385, partial [bacterium]|nr:hypothetical protein [bacterium]
MPVDTCIANVGEYYSSHYLDSTFAGDLKQWIQQWREQGSQSVPQRLKRLSPLYFRAKNRALEEDDPDKRWVAEELAAWHSQLLSALGYTSLEPADVPVSHDHAVAPVRGRYLRYNKPWLFVCETVFCLPDASLKEGRPSEDPFQFSPLRDQLADASHALLEDDWSRVIGRLFTEEEAPRWILFLAGSQVFLLDKHTYAQGRYLAFDLD